MEAERPEVRFLHMTGKNRNRSVFMESNLIVLSQLQLHRLYDSAVRGWKEPFTFSKFETLN